MKKLFFLALPLALVSFTRLVGMEGTTEGKKKAEPSLTARLLDRQRGKIEEYLTINPVNATFKQLMTTLFPILEQRPDLEEAFSYAKTYNDLALEGYYFDQILALDATRRSQSPDAATTDNLKNKVSALIDGLFISFFYAPTYTHRILQQLSDTLKENPQSKPIFSTFFKEAPFPPAHRLTQEIMQGQAKYMENFSYPAPLIHYAALMRPTALQALIDLGAEATQEIDFQSALSIAIDLYKQPIFSLIERTAATPDLSFDIQAAAIEASYDSKKEWVEALLLHGADPEYTLRTLELNKDIGAEKSTIPQEIVQLLKEGVAKKQSEVSTSGSLDTFKKPQAKKTRIEQKD